MWAIGTALNEVPSAIKQSDLHFREMYYHWAVPFDPFDRPYLLEHFERHKHEFGAATADEYEQMADAFWLRPAFPPLFECTRRNGSRCRYDVVTEEYSVMATWNSVLTFFSQFHVRNWLKPVNILKIVTNSGRTCSISMHGANEV